MGHPVAVPPKQVSMYGISSSWVVPECHIPDRPPAREEGEVAIGREVRLRSSVVILM
jgi:hypothetical protein